MTQTISTASYLCIGCPMGCRLEVDTAEEDRIVEIRGFSCKRGKEYAAQEHVDPRRNVAFTVGLRGGALSRLPVKTSAAVPNARVLALCAALRDLVVDAPVRVGQVVAVNPLGLGADIVATREMGALD